MTDRKKGILDKIGNLIPGFKGYVIREEKRNDDNKLRDKLHALLKDSETEIINFQQELIKQGNISKCQEWEIVRKSINTLYSKIKYSSEGESSFFSNNQIKETELDLIYSYDLEISERVTLIYSITNSTIDEELSAVAINQQVKGILEKLSERSNFITQYK
jgi:hypothetical protein